MIADPQPAAHRPQLPEPEFTPLILQPRSKFLRRLPVMLYRLGFGPILGVMPLLILSTRTHDGQTLYTPLEYRRHGSRIYVLATGGDAGWLKRMRNAPNVTLRIGSSIFPAAAQTVTDEGETVRALFQFRMNAPAPLRWVYWSGRNRDITHPLRFKDAAQRYTFVRLERLPDSAAAVQPVLADRAWMSALAAAILLGIAALLWWKRL